MRNNLKFIDGPNTAPWKAVSVEGHWCFGYPIYIGEAWYFMRSKINMLEIESYVEVLPHTMCEPTGMLIPIFPDNQSFGIMLHVNDRVDLQGTEAFIERRQGYFSWSASDYHIGTIAFCGSNPMMKGNKFDFMVKKNPNDNA
jgi:hypothetical protein